MGRIIAWAVISIVGNQSRDYSATNHSVKLYGKFAVRSSPYSTCNGANIAPTLSGCVVTLKARKAVND